MTMYDQFDYRLVLAGITLTDQSAEVVWGLYEVPRDPGDTKELLTRLTVEEPREYVDDSDLNTFVRNAKETVTKKLIAAATELMSAPA